MSVFRAKRGGQIVPEPRNHLKAGPGNEVRRFFARAGRKELIGETVKDKRRIPET